MVQIYQVKVGLSWMDPIVSFLKDDTLPEEKSETEKNTKKSSLVLVVRGSQVVQALLFWAVFVMFTSRNIRVTA